MPIVDEIKLNKKEFVGLNLGGVLNQVKDIIIDKMLHV